MLSNICIAPFIPATNLSELNFSHGTCRESMCGNHGFIGNSTNGDSWEKMGFLMLIPFFETSPCTFLRIPGEEQ